MCFHSFPALWPSSTFAELNVFFVTHDNASPLQKLWLILQVVFLPIKKVSWKIFGVQEKEKKNTVALMEKL